MNASTKVSKGKTKLADLESVFRALAHASRRQILLVLHFRGGSMTSSEIAGRFSCRWPTTTRHLRKLEQAGLVTLERKGRESIYSLNHARLRSVAGDWLAVFSTPQGR